MNEQAASWKNMLIECIEAAKMPGAELDYEPTASVETESESINISVHFDEAGSPQASLNLRSLLQNLERSFVVSAVDLIAPPHARLTVHGAIDKCNFKVVFHL